MHEPDDDEEQDRKILFQHQLVTFGGPCPGCAPATAACDCSGADGETRTPTAYATAPSRQRVYQFHHVGVI